MSRSYHKHVCFTIRDTAAKRYANRRVRRTTDLMQGGNYRKLCKSECIAYSSWGFRDENEFVAYGLSRSNCNDHELRRMFRTMRAK